MTAAAWFGARLRAASPRAIAIAGYLVFLLYAYPGYMATDAVDQLVDSRVGTFTDWSSPVMTELWRLTGHVLAGPLPMLAVQSGLLLAGAFALLARVMSRRAAMAAACGLLLFPPVLATMAVVGPDGQLAGFAIAGAAALTSPRRGWQVAGAALLVVAAGMSDGSALAIAPIVVLGLELRAGQPRWQRYAVATAAWLAIAGAGLGLDRVLVDNATRRPELELATVDLVGMVRHADHVTDPELGAALAGVRVVTTTDAKARAGAWSAHPEQVTAGPRRWFEPPATPAERDAVIAARATLRVAHPGAYLRHRWQVLTRVLGFGRTPGWDPVYTGFTGTPEQRVAIRHAARHSAVQRGLVTAVEALEATIVFRPYLYAALALALLGLAIAWRQRAAAMVVASGLAYDLALMIVTATPAYRLSLWPIVATVIGGALLAVAARGRRRAG